VSDTMTITPSVIIRRAHEAEPGAAIEVVWVPYEKTLERALLVFASPEIAETFQADTGLYTEEEGFRVMPSDIEQLRVVLWGGDFKHIAVRGWESPDALDFFDAAEFLTVLREGLEA
jgi:hypothetical protein